MEKTNLTDAIKHCEKNIVNHRMRATIFLIIMLTMIVVFSFGQYYYLIIENNNTKHLIERSDEIKTTIEELSFVSKEHERLISGAMNMIDDAIASSNSGARYQLDRIISDLRADSSQINLAMHRVSRVSSILSNHTGVFPQNIIYIIYAIFIAIFGVTTSFYRFHLKEVSKYEHSQLGYYRIRLAIDQSKTGFDDDIKFQIINNAFDIGSKVSKDKVESPLPGNPSSDIFAMLVNKLTELIDEIRKTRKSNPQGN